MERVGGAMNRQLHCCFSASKYVAASWGSLHWERQICASAASRRPLGSAAGADMSVLVTGASRFVGAHCSLALCKHGDDVVGGNINDVVRFTSTSPHQTGPPRASSPTGWATGSGSNEGRGRRRGPLRT
ncbi:hypothetical protein ACQ4PT_038050 [Festuca glaucescens]